MPNSVIIHNLGTDHPNHELLVRFSHYSNGFPPVIIREPIDAPSAIVCFESEEEAINAQKAEEELTFGPVGLKVFFNSNFQTEQNGKTGNRLRKFI